MKRREIINIYCDESCHLQNEQEKRMFVSCIYCPKDLVSKISNDIRQLKQKHKIWKYAEIKWTKISKSRQDFYLELLNYFLSEPNLHFRTIIIADKTKLNHEIFGQNHNTWYYKMIYQLVEYVIAQKIDKHKKNRDDYEYNIFADKKENSSQARRALLVTKDCLQTHFAKPFLFHNIASHQSEIMQLNDFFLCAVAYFNRGLYKNKNAISTKKLIIDVLIKELNISLNKKNYNDKFNILVWEAKH